MGERMNLDSTEFFYFTVFSKYIDHYWFWCL